jgi:hypothetical protein
MYRSADDSADGRLVSWSVMGILRDDLRTAAADVDNQGIIKSFGSPSGSSPECAFNAQKSKTSLFLPGDHPYIDAGPLAHLGNEFSRIGRIPQRTGSHGRHPDGRMRVDAFPEIGEDPDGAIL